MTNISYTTLQRKYPGKLVAILESQGKVVASGKTVQNVEKELNEKNINPERCLFLGPIEHYNQISVY